MALVDDELLPLEDVALPMEAGSVDQLWREFLVGPRSRRTTHHWSAVELFRTFHDEDQPDGALTALLLCTDPRWDGVAGRLLRAIVATGLLDDEALNGMAATLMESDSLSFECPDNWWGEAILIAEDDAPEERVAEPAAPPSFRRRISPPLRRWAAGRAVARGLATADDVLRRAGDLDRAGAAGVVSGLLEEVDALDARTAERAIEIGAQWPVRSVRIQALERIAERDGFRVAVRIAAEDPDATVRAWARRPAKRQRSFFAP